MYGNGFEEAMMVFFGIFAVTFLVIGIGALVLYILRCVGIMTLARNRGMSNPWVIWIPLVGVYTIGALADDIQAREGKRTAFRWLLLGGNILTYVISIVSSAASIGSLVDMFGNFDPYSYGFGESYFEGMTRFSMISGLLGGPASLISLAVYVITIIALFYIYKCYKPESSTAYTVLSVIFPFMQSIFPFAIRNNQPHWLNPPPYYGAPGGFPPPPPNGFPGESQNPGFQYGQPPNQGFTQPPQGFTPPPPQGFAPPPPPDFGQQPYNPYGQEPAQEQPQQEPQPTQEQESFGDDPNRQ
jgi:hypothetical protein